MAKKKAKGGRTTPKGTRPPDRSGLDFSSFLHSSQRAEALASKRSIEAWRAEHP